MADVGDGGAGNRRRMTGIELRKYKLKEAEL